MFYIIGVLAGAVAGFVAGKVFRSMA
jgi:hypothetical protein